MKKNIKKVIKITAVSILSISLFNAAFAVSSLIVYAAPPTGTITAASNAINEYPFPKITVVEEKSHYDDRKPSNIITTEQAAEIGARYIGDIFDADIDGRTVSISFDINPRTGKPIWMGRVLLPGIESESMQSTISNRNFNTRLYYDYDFRLNAVSGALETINYVQRDETLQENTIRASEYRSITRSRGERRPENYETYAQIALEYAQRYFTDTEVRGVTYGGMGFEMSGMIDSMNNNRDLYNTFMAYKERLLNFVATNQLGHEIYVTISAETKQLYTIITGQDNFAQSAHDNRSHQRTPSSSGLTIQNGKVFVDDTYYPNLTEEDVIAIRQDPSHPLYIELFGSPRNIGEWNSR